MPDDAGGFVEVVYARSQGQDIVRLARTPGMTAAEAVRRSGLPARYPELRTREPVLGVYGARVRPNRPLAAGDRVEICRPLQRDPREMRRCRT